MDWDSIIRVVDVDPAALKRPAGKKWSRDAAVGAALLLLEVAPHSAAALVGGGITARRGHSRPVAAAPALHAAPALAEWRADPDRAKRRIGVWNTSPSSVASRI